MEYQFNNSATEEKSFEEQIEKKTTMNKINQGPTPAFIGASWVALVVGMISYCVGLWNVNLLLNEKGYYFTILLFGLFSAISVQKSVRDRLEGMQVTSIYYSISWFCAVASIILLVVGLRNADIELSEKGFFGMSYILSLFASIAVQKNTRDKQYAESLG